jgi:hypothetical protein
MPRKPKRICVHVGRQVARVSAYDLRYAETLELVGLAVGCHNLAAMSVEELNRRLPEDDRIELNGIWPRLRVLRGKSREPVH